MEKHYLYKHTNKNNNKIYIGITVQEPEKRWGSGGINYRNNRYFWNAIQKYGWDNFDHEILLESDSEKEIKDLEERYIREFKSSNRKYGYNIALGGELNRHSDETKILISKLGKGRRLTTEQKNKISSSLKGRKNPSAKAFSKKIEGINIKTKELLQFNSIKDASEILKLPRAGISGTCTGRYSFVKDFIFKYSNDLKRNLVEDINNIQVTNSKKVIGTDIKNGEIREFLSSEDAARELQLGKSAGSKIRECIAGKTNTAYGFHWQNKESFRNLTDNELKNMLDINNRMKNKKIKGIHIKTHKVVIFNNSEEAARQLNLANGSNIRNACKSGKQSAGYFWSYV